MNRLLYCLGAASILLIATPAMAKDYTAQSARLTCNVSGLYADGSRIAGTGSEEISIDIRRTADPAQPMVDLRVTSNGRIHPGTLIHSANNQIAFVLADYGQIDGYAQNVALIYELRLDQMRLKRTLTTLFSTQGNALQSSEGNCIRTGTATAPAAMVPAGSPAPAWLPELRRKLKECGSKDPFSQSTCTERIRARFCTNQAVQVPECVAQ